MLTRNQRLTERETILRWDAHKDVVNCFTASPAVKRKVERAGHRVKKASTVKGREVGWFFQIPYRNLFWSVRPRKITVTPHGFAARRASGGP